VFLQSGRKDEVATQDEHRAIFADLKRAGFRRVQIAYFPGAHEVDAAPLRAALDWFRAMSTVPATTK
jgi:predicted esterase